MCIFPTHVCCDDLFSIYPSERFRSLLSSMKELPHSSLLLVLQLPSQNYWEGSCYQSREKPSMQLQSRIDARKGCCVALVSSTTERTHPVLVWSNGVFSVVASAWTAKLPHVSIGRAPSYNVWFIVIGFIASSQHDKIGAFLTAVSNPRGVLAFICSNSFIYGTW